jgi:hydrogenase-4 component B
MSMCELVLLDISCLFWLIALVTAIFNIKSLFSPARYLYALGCLLLIITDLLMMSSGMHAVSLHIHFANQLVYFHLTMPALWLLLFGLISAFFICICNSKSTKESAQRFWLIGLGFCLFGALGVFSLQDAASFLIAWECMSLGGGVMVIAERLSDYTPKSAFFMLGLLEVGAVALILAFISLSYVSNSTEFSQFTLHSPHLSMTIQFFVGLLFVFGFGAKLGILPFYEWYPAAYSSASGATGALFSGLILNAGVFALLRALVHWLPADTGTFALGVVLSIVAVISGIMSILYAFQQSDWRALLSLSSAENACLAMLMIGVCLIFRSEHFFLIAAMATIIVLLHMAAHTLAKSTLLLTADGVYISTDSYKIAANGIIKKAMFWGVGVFFAVMSLSAMPPQSGFLSEWYAFQTIFHGFKLHGLTGKITLTFVGAGLALSSAIAFASYIKVFGVGLLGPKNPDIKPIPYSTRLATSCLGVFVLALAVGLPWFIFVLTSVSTQWFGVDVISKMHTEWLMIPLSAHFAFASPPLLAIVIPCFCLVPIFLLFITKRFKVRRAPVWYGGRHPDSAQASATTANVFSNALRTVYSFVYRTKVDIKEETTGKSYFVTKITTQHKVSLFYTKYLFHPLILLFYFIANRLQKLQSGNINFYNFIIWFLLILALLSVFM